MTLYINKRSFKYELFTFLNSFSCEVDIHKFYYQVLGEFEDHIKIIVLTNKGNFILLWYFNFELFKEALEDKFKSYLKNLDYHVYSENQMMIIIENLLYYQIEEGIPIENNFKIYNSNNLEYIGKLFISSLKSNNYANFFTLLVLWFTFWLSNMLYPCEEFSIMSDTFLFSYITFAILGSIKLSYRYFKVIKIEQFQH